MNHESLERIRESRRNLIAAVRADHQSLGRRWALESAEYDDLEGVAKLGEDATLVDLLLALAPPGERALQDTPLQAPPTMAHAERVAHIFGPCEPSAEDVRAFISGAREVFHAV